MALQGVRVPRLTAGVDLTKLPLSPLEGFVLSRIDGVAPLAVLADLTNLEEAQVERIVERLIALGAAEWVRESVSLPRATSRAAGTPSKPFTVPESLRAPPRTMLNAARPIHPADASTHKGPTSPYKQSERPEERVDPTRRSVFPGATPRASHTGTLEPAGELEDLEIFAEADTIPPPPPASPAAEPPIPEAPLAPTAPEASAAAPSQPPAEEELDLDEARRRRIDDLFVALDLLDHYQVLGVERGAKREDVRTAYFTLSKVFHPDTMFRKRLGTYKAKMETIFQRLTEAYDVLGKKRAREEYDRYLELADRTRQVEDVLDPDADAAEQRELARAAAHGEADLASEAAPPPGPAERQPAEPEPDHAEPDHTEPTHAEPTPAEPVAASAEAVAAPRRESSPEARARARELMARRLRSAVRASEAGRTRGTPAAPSEPPPPTAPAKEQVLRDLASSLKSSASHTGGLEPVQRHMLAARRAERDGDLAEAARELRLALSITPERQELVAEHARVSALLAASLSSTYEERAQYEQRHGKWAAAAISWAKVFEGRPHDARAARLAAEALIEAKGDLHRAKQLAQRAAELAPDDLHALRALARVYQAAGLRLNARRVLERAAALDPKDEMVENLLRELDR